MSFDKYSSREYNEFVSSLERWGTLCITDDEMKSYSLKPEMDPIDSDAPFDVVQAIVKDDDMEEASAIDDSLDVVASSPSPPLSNLNNLNPTLDNDNEPRGPVLDLTLPGSFAEEEEDQTEFDTYNDLLGHGSQAFNWDPQALAPNEQNLLPSSANTLPQQAPLYFGTSFLPSSSMQPMFAGMQNSSPYGQVQSDMTFGMTPMMQPLLPGTRVVSEQLRFSPTNAVEGNYSNEQPRFTHEQSLQLQPSFQAPVDMTAPSAPILSSILAESSNTSTDHTRPPDSIIATATRPSNKENLSSNESNLKTKADGTDGSRKKIVAPRPKARAVPKKMNDPSWCLKACDSLRRSLKGPDACEAVARWKSLEELLGYPKMTKKPADNLVQTNAPDCLQAYIAAGRSDAFEPERAVEDVSQQFKKFWRTLQPDWRQKTESWPMTRQQSVEAADWSGLLKGSPNGFFLVLKVLAFWASMAWTREERKEFDETVADVNWVLGELLKQVNGGSVLGVRKRRG